MSKEHLSRDVDLKPMSREHLYRDVGLKPMSREHLSRDVDLKPMSREHLSRDVDLKPMSRDLTKKTRHSHAWSSTQYLSDPLDAFDHDGFVCEYFTGVVFQFFGNLPTQPCVDGFECFPEHERPHFCVVCIACDDMDQSVFDHLERCFLQLFAEVSGDGCGGHLGEYAFIHQFQ